MNINLAEYILKLYTGIGNIRSVLGELNEKDAISQEIIDIMKTLEKSLVTYHNILSDHNSMELNRIFNDSIKILKKIKSIDEIKHMIKKVDFYLSETKEVLNKIQCDIKIIKKKYVDSLNGINTTKKRIVVLGVDSFTVNINRLIKQTKAEIIAFCTSDPKYKWNNINGIPVIGTEVLDEIDFDYLINGQDSNQIYNDPKTLDVLGYIKRYYDFEVSRVMYEFLLNKTKINGLITGLSYAETGIDVKKLRHFNFLNAALSSQDLYYDFELAKYFLSDQVISKNLKYAIINLGYSSFEYDLSLSINKHRTYFYHPFIKKLHHNFNLPLVRKYEVFMEIAKEILVDNFHMVLYELLKVNAEKNWGILVNGMLGNEQIKQTDRMVEKDCNKNYPLTVRENIGILSKYIEFLQSRNIIPLLTICPTNKRYSSKFSQRIKTEFKEIIKKISEEYNVKVLDYFDSEIFDDSDFYDVSHLNKKGANKFTQIINKELSKYENNL